MTSRGNFIITIIAITLALLTATLYLLLNIEPNIFWVVLMIVLIGIIATLIASIVFYSFSKLRSFETPRDMYRRQFKKSIIIGLLAVVILLIQKFFNLI